MQQIKIGNKVIGENAPCFIVAEISANHNQDLENAKALIRAAKEAGADAVKLQTYTPDTLTIDCDNELFIVNSNNSWHGKTLYKLYSEAFTPWEWHAKLFKIAEKEGLICFSTPFDETSIILLEDLNTPLYKIASFEIIDIPLLEQVGRLKKPVIMSTGMATLEEIEEAVQTLCNAGTTEIILLKCTSAYPAPYNSMNLKTIQHLKNHFDTLVGLSDHTLTDLSAIAAVALGAKVIEKHFTLSRAQGGPDSAFSIEPSELKKMVENIRATESALGNVNYSRTSAEEQNVNFRRSLFVIKDIPRGSIFDKTNVRSIRPGYGLHPRFLSSVLGKKANKDIKSGTPLAWDLME